ncbi:MAG: methionine synthase [Micrococcales bacterium]|nr:methionine synthase [Micrococcales bacterium]
MTAATGIGSWPGTSVREALTIVRDLLSGADDDGVTGIPYLPELPSRGPGSDIIGRSAGLLVELAVDLQPAGWRFVDRPGKDAARTASLWREDLDQLTEVFDGYAGPLKLQVAGPWTLGAGIHLHRGERAVVDAGAMRDLAGSLAEGVRAHLADIRRLVPGASPVVQIDEPSLPSVLAGRLPTASGYGTIRAVDPQVVGAALTEVIDAAGEGALVHCCDRGIPIPLLRGSGAAGIALDTSLLTPAGWESVAASVESGTTLYAGCLPTDGSLTASGAAERLTRTWDELGLDPQRLTEVVLTPACGLAGQSAEGAVRLQRNVIDAARHLSDRAASSR